MDTSEQYIEMCWRDGSLWIDHDEIILGCWVFKEDSWEWQQWFYDKDTDAWIKR